MGNLIPQELATTAWAFATLKRLDEKLFTSLARAARRRVSEFNSQALANTAWAFATVMQLDQKLLTTLARAAERRVSEFDVQAFANTAWTFATVKQPDQRLHCSMRTAFDFVYMQKWLVQVSHVVPVRALRHGKQR